MRKNIGFTLAEVLITLVIIGVIAAMTIPTLMGSTNEQEVKSKLKKGFAAANNALALEYSLYGNTTIKDGVPAGQMTLVRMLSNHLSVVLSERRGDDYLLKTADGIEYFVWEGDNGQGGGFHIAFKPDNDGWRDASWCYSLEECENYKPNVFPETVYCGKDTDHKACAASIVGYAYLYDMPVRDVVEKYGLEGIGY